MAASGNKTVQAQVLNAGFEEPVFADGDFSNSGAGGWTVGFYTLPDLVTWNDASDADESGGIWNPTAGDYPAEAPEGDNVGWAWPYPGLDTGLTQVLSVTLAADTQYVLSAHVGNATFDDNLAPGTARFEIHAGGVLVAASASIPGPSLGTFANHSLVYDSGADPAQLGETLEIRLLCEGDSGAEMDFDAVSLLVVEPHVEVPTVTADHSFRRQAFCGALPKKQHDKLSID